MAYQLAAASSRITADVIEVQEFPDLGRKYEIRSVPMTVLNEAERLMGAVPALHVVEAIERAARPA